MKLRLIFPIGAILLILGVATCCYLQDKKNQQRVILDDKAVNKDTGINYGIGIPDSAESTGSYYGTTDITILTSTPSIWIDSWYPKTKSRSGINYHDLIQLNDNQYLFVGKDGFGNTFDSTIITINK